MEILTDSLHKVAYATDASVYREIPYGVAYPKDEADLVALIGEACHRGTSIIARAGGTSIAGQVVGHLLGDAFEGELDRMERIRLRDGHETATEGGVRLHAGGDSFLCAGGARR